MNGVFEVPAQLPGLNEIIAANRSAPQVGARQKKEWTAACVLAIRHARTNGRLPRACMKGPVSIFFDWFEPIRSPQSRRDPDNIMAGQKFILDAMVKERVLSDDGPEDILSLTHRFHIETNPRVQVDVYEITTQAGERIPPGAGDSAGPA